MHTLLLVLVGLSAGIGITAVGPGGVLSTVGLVHLTALSPAVIAGTVMTTNIANGIVGTAAYARSGHLKVPTTRKLVGVLTLTALVGTPVGAALNAGLSDRDFKLILGFFLLIVAGLVWRRELAAKDNLSGTNTQHPQPKIAILIALGLIVAAVSGLLGVGGPVLTVPLLVAMGVPILPALAAAQVQSIVISTVGSASYIFTGAFDWKIALIIGIPQLIGVLAGWKIARAVPGTYLNRALIVVLLALAPTLLLL